MHQIYILAFLPRNGFLLNFIQLILLLLNNIIQQLIDYEKILLHFQDYWKQVLRVKSKKYS